MNHDALDARFKAERRGEIASPLEDDDAALLDPLNPLNYGSGRDLPNDD
jgi:hypothetical protein